jgi:hypothetical protein
MNNVLYRPYKIINSKIYRGPHKLSNNKFSVNRILKYYIQGFGFALTNFIIFYFFNEQNGQSGAALVLSVTILTLLVHFIWPVYAVTQISDLSLNPSSPYEFTILITYIFGVAFALTFRKFSDQALYLELKELGDYYRNSDLIQYELVIQAIRYFLFNKKILTHTDLIFWSDQGELAALGITGKYQTMDTYLSDRSKINNTVSTNVNKIKALDKQPLAGMGENSTQNFESPISKMNVLQQCRKCGNSQSLIARICTNCGAELLNCNICKRGFGDDEDTISCFHCNNKYHRDHIFTYVRSYGECPVCKKPLTIENLM